MVGQTGVGHQLSPSFERFRANLSNDFQQVKGIFKRPALHGCSKVSHCRSTVPAVLPVALLALLQPHTCSSQGLPNTSNAPCRARRVPYLSAASLLFVSLAKVQLLWAQTSLLKQ